MAYKIIEAEPHQRCLLCGFSMVGRILKIEFERLWNSMALLHSLFACSLVTVFLASLSFL